MKYGDLFQLQPIQSVIQLNQADDINEAMQLVGRFVVTDSLADALNRVALPQLAKKAGVEGKGLFVVGNYGTGKSHLMSFLSALAEHAEALDHLRDPAKWRAAFTPIAGRFVVRRTQIDGAAGTLYWIVAQELTALAKQHGVEFTFLPQDQLVNAKTEYQRYMEALTPALGGRGVIWIVDELLHFLVGRDDHQRVLDLQTLQGLGEFCRGPSFVFIAGLQQSLFQDKRFQNLSDEISKVSQRFNDLVIDAKGVEQLIETYVFAKTLEQKAEIRRMFSAQADLYEIVGTELERFVALFPAHPLFIDEFQRISVVERREILTVLSSEGAIAAETELNGEQLRLITSDRYWSHIEANVNLDANTNIKKVKDPVRSLRAKINDAQLPAEDKVLAERLIAALAVNRLTTPTINDKVGLSPLDLKNRLLPPARGLMRDRTVLENGVKRLLEKVREAAAGQLLTTTIDGKQYYIDPTRTTDYDEEVRAASRTLTPTVWQRHFNEFVLLQLETESPTPVIQGRLWHHVLPWKDKNIDRPGWLFFDFPSHRSTAKPAKDFYVFLLPSTRISKLADDDFPDRRDEIYVQFEGFPVARCSGDDESVPQTFLDHLRLWAAARERQRELQGNKDGVTATETIANQFYDLCKTAWRQDCGDWIQIRHHGKSKTLRLWVQEVAPGKAATEFKERLKVLSAHLLADSFAEDYPDYPKFAEPMTETSRLGASHDAVKLVCDQGMAGGTPQGRSVLAALELYKDKVWTFDASPWLRGLRERIEALKDGQSISAAQLFETRRGRRFAKDSVLEAEWFMPVLAAGVRAGEVVVVFEGGVTVNAAGLQNSCELFCNEAKVVRVTRPVDFPREAWRKLFKLLGVNEGLLAHDGTLEDAAVKWHEAVFKRVQGLVELRQRLLGRLPLAATDVAPTVDLAPLDSAKATLEQLQVYNSRGMMLNLKLRDDALIAAFGKQLQLCDTLHAVGDFVRDNGQNLGALERLRVHLLGLDIEFADLCDKAATALQDVYAVNLDAGPIDLAALRKPVDDACARGCKVYRGCHKRRRLNKDEDGRKSTLVSSGTVRTLQKLAGVSNLSATSLDKQLQELGSLRLFKDYTDAQLLASPTAQAPGDPFDPQKEPPESAADVLVRCESALATLVDTWTARLLTDLKDPSVAKAIAALTEAERKPIEMFQINKSLPTPVTDEFVRVLNLLFAGLELIKVDLAGFVWAVLDADQPLTPDEVRERFEKWLAAQVGGRDSAKVRLVPESVDGLAALA